MRRLEINNLKVDTTIKKEQLIKGVLTMPTEFRGNYLNNMIMPITYNNLSDNTVYYDGDEYTLNGNTFYKNGTAILNFTPTHVELQEEAPLVDRDEWTSGSYYVRKIGATISYNLDIGTGTINVLDCGYDYILTAKKVGSIYYITLFPMTPTKYKDVCSWSVSATSVVEQHTYFINPNNELVTIANNTCTVASNTICNVLFEDFIMSGDTNHVFYTAYNDNHYYYSNIEFFNSSATSWLTTDCMLLATSQDGIYYGGFKVTLNNWSIDYYNNIPVQVSYKNKVIVNQVDYAYFNNGKVYVEIKGKTYQVAIVSGTKYSIVGDRFIALNAPDTYYNTYDMETGETFCRNPSYNGSILWTIPENALVEDEDSRGTIYVATGVNVQGQTDGSYLQGTIWPSFPVYGLEDNKYALVDYWNDTANNIVQVYKGTTSSPTVAEYVFSLGGSLDYTGYVYPDSTNTLYSVSEVDELYNTYSGVMLVKGPYGSYLSAVNNIQEPSFSYYVGTLAELDNIFVLRGTMYGITSTGYIVSMTVENGAITSTSIITKSGTMQFIGNTQEYALFYSPFEKQLYIFNASLRLSQYKEFSINEPLYYTCRPEDDKIAIATVDSIYVISGNIMFRIESEVNQLKFCKGWLLGGTRAYSSYDGQYKLDVEFDSGLIGNTLDTTIQLDEVIVMLDDSDLDVPSYLEYRVSIGNEYGELKELTNVDCKNIVRIKPTTTRNEDLYYRIWLKTNCNLMGVSIFDNAEKKPNLTRNNG